MLLLHGSSVNDPTLTDLAWTPLHFGVVYKQPEIVSMLVDNGASMRPCGADGPFPSMTPLDIAQRKAEKPGKARQEWRDMISILETCIL